MRLAIGAKSARTGVSSGAAQRRSRARSVAGVAGNQAALRRLSPRLQRQTPDPSQDQPKPDPKPLLPLGKDWKFDPSAMHTDPPKPWDQPGAGSGGNGVSLEDVHKGWSILFGGKSGPPPLNLNFKMPPCSALESADSTAAAPKYKSFETYDMERKLLHSPLDKEPWPQLTREQYQAAVDGCKAKTPQAPAPQPVPMTLPPPTPLQNDVPNPLPPGQAYA